MDRSHANYTCSCRDCDSDCTLLRCGSGLGKRAVGACPVPVGGTFVFIQISYVFRFQLTSHAIGASLSWGLSCPAWERRFLGFVNNQQSELLHSVYNVQIQTRIRTIRHPRSTMPSFSLWSSPLGGKPKWLPFPFGRVPFWGKTEMPSFSLWSSPLGGKPKCLPFPFGRVPFALGGIKQSTTTRGLY